MSSKNKYLGKHSKKLPEEEYSQKQDLKCDQKSSQELKRPDRLCCKPETKPRNERTSQKNSARDCSINIQSFLISVTSIFLFKMYSSIQSMKPVFCSGWFALFFFNLNMVSDCFVMFTWRKFSGQYILKVSLNYHHKEMAFFKASIPGLQTFFHPFNLTMAVLIPIHFCSFKVSATTTRVNSSSLSFYHRLRIFTVRIHNLKQSLLSVVSYLY